MSGQVMVNVTIATFNRLEFTKECIAALPGAGSMYTLTVVDNGSSDGTPEYLRGLKEQGIVHNLFLLETNIGVAAAQNLGWLIEPDAEHYLKLDNDIVMKKEGWLDRMIVVSQAVPEIGCLAYSFEHRSYPSVAVRGIAVRPKDAALGGACFLVPRQTRQRLGTWCEEYGLYGEEDADYCCRARLAGYLTAYMEDEDSGIHLPGGKAALLDKSANAAGGGEELTHSRYRLWKDQQRRKNCAAGSAFRRNMDQYSLFPASLRKVSRILSIEGESYARRLKERPEAVNHFLRAKRYYDEGRAELGRRILEEHGLLPQEH